MGLNRISHNIKKDSTKSQSTKNKKSPEYSLEGLMLNSIRFSPESKGQLMRKDPDTREDWKQEEKGVVEDEMASITDSDGHEREPPPGDSEEQELWHAAVSGIRKNGYNLVTGKQQLREYFWDDSMDMRCNIPWVRNMVPLRKEGRQTLRCSPSKRTGVLVPILQMQKLRPRGM